MLQRKKSSVICTIYSAKVSDLLNYLGPLAIKILKANLACPVTGLTVHVLKFHLKGVCGSAEWALFVQVKRAVDEWYHRWPVQCFLEQLGLQCVNLVMYQSISSLESADLSH